MGSSTISSLLTTAAHGINASLPYLVAIGFGGIIGVFINNYFLGRENKKKLLFEARIKAYSGLVSRFFNLFNELDVNRLNEALRFVKINELLSEAYLVGSKEFVEKLSAFKPKLLEFHNELDEVVRNKKQDEVRAIELHRILVNDIGDIYNQMRRDLFLSGVAIDELKLSAAPSSVFELRGLSPQEIAERHSDSVKEAIEAKDAPEAHETLEVEQPVNAEEKIELEEKDYLQLLPKIEENALNILSSSLGMKIERQVTFAGLPLRFDGAHIDNEKKILRFFEVKTFPALPRNKNGKVMTFALVAKLQKTLTPIVTQLTIYLEKLPGYSDWKNILTFAIVLNTKQDFVKFRRRIQEIEGELNSISSKADLKIKFVFYNLKNMNLDLSEE